MSPLAANLKHLYQFRFMWIYHLILVSGILSLFTGMMTIDTSGDLSEVSWIMFILVGEMFGMAITGTSARPFSFCLPNHERAVKKMLLTIWMAMVLLCLLIVSILYLFNVHIDPSLFIASICLMSLCFWSGVSVFIRKLGFIPLFFSMTAFLIISFKDMGITIFPAIANHPWILVLSSNILCFLIYHATGSRRNHRQLCTTPWFGFGDSSQSRQRLIKRKWMRQAEKHATGITDDLFSKYITDRIRSKHHSGLIPHLWGQVYLLTAPIFSRWKFLWIPFLFAYIMLILVPCVIIESTKPGFFYFFDGMMLVFSSFAFSILFTNQRFKYFLFPGRNVHFFRGIVVLLTTMLLSLGFFGISILSFNYLSALFPEITVMGRSLTFLSIPPIMLIIPLIHVPLFGGLFILFKGIVLRIALTVTGVIALIVTIFGMPAMETAPFLLNLAVVVIAAAITWGFHLAALYYTSMKRSLC